MAQVLGSPDTLVSATVPRLAKTKYTYSIDPNGNMTATVNGVLINTPFISPLATITGVTVQLGRYNQNDEQTLNGGLGTFLIIPKVLSEAEQLLLTAPE